MVFWRAGQLLLLTEKFDCGVISDFDEIYERLGDHKAEIVEVDENEVTGMVVLKSIYVMSFYNKDDQPCTADEVITNVLASAPNEILATMLDNEK